MKKLILSSLMATLVLFAACSGSVTKEDMVAKVDSTAVSEVISGAVSAAISQEEAVNQEDEPPRKEEVITVSGTITYASIDPYPMGHLVFAPDDGSDTLDMYFEGTTVETEALPNRIGEQATITYRVEHAKQPTTIFLVKEKTFFGSDEKQDDWGMDEGILKADQNALGGDLPGYIELELDNGEVETFEDFFTDDIIAHNGKRVQVFYWSDWRLVLEKVK